MEKDFPSDYQKGLLALQDIVQLAGVDVGPLATNALYHFSKLRRANEDLSALPSLQGFLQSSIKELVQSFLVDKFPGNQVSLCVRPGPSSLDEWDRLLDGLPALLELRSFFLATGPLHLEISSGHAVFTGRVALDTNAKEHRARAYQIYRKLFSKRIVACYSITPTSTAGECILELRADLSDDATKCYAIDMGKGIGLALPSSFSNYVVANINMIGNGPCFEITDRFGLINHRRFPAAEWELDGPRRAIHFPFLFRPISLIIPYEGKLIPHLAADNDEYTGSGDSRARIRLHRLDFFSFFNS